MTYINGGLLSGLHLTTLLKDYAEYLIETANVMIVGLDVAGNIRVFNEAAEKITGYKKTEVLGKNCFETLMPQGLSPDAWQAFHAWRTTGQITKHYESQILTKSSKTRIVSWQSSEVKDRGKVTGILSFGNDITEQKQMKSLVERLRLMSFVRDVSVALSDGAVLGDILRACAEAIVRNLDAALARIWTFNEKDKVLELQASEGISTRSDSGYSRVPIDKYREDDKRVALSGKTDEMDEKYSVGGQELIVHTMKTPIKDEAGNVIGILGIFWDITEKVTLELETLRTRHLASLGELSAGIAHEINNPLNGIINYAQILLNRKGKEDKEADILGKIVKEGNRAATIVKNLLSFARPTGENEKKVLARISEIMSGTFALVGAKLRKTGITTKLNLPDKLPAILAHPQQIQQVFLNLISNAQYALCEKYPASHVDKILEVSGETVTIDNATYIKVVFCDHGTGIPPSAMNKIMDPFFTTKPRNRGTGLGLSICHGIIRDHGGKLLVESEEGEYTRVSVLLPAFCSSNL